MTVITPPSGDGRLSVGMVDEWEPPEVIANLISRPTATSEAPISAQTLLRLVPDMTPPTLNVPGHPHATEKH